MTADQTSASPAHDPTILPASLPIPTDDGACLHLRGRALPSMSLPSTAGKSIRFDTLAAPAVLFFYPRTGVPGRPPGFGYAGEEWDSIPGARGCTPQSCGFRDLAADFRSLGVAVYGVSTSTTAHQLEFKARMHFPFDILSDSDLALTRALNLPTFRFPVESGGPDTLLMRMACYIEPDASGTPRIRKVWYPVFPPNENAANVLAWLRSRSPVNLAPIAATDLAFLSEEHTRHWGGLTIYSRFKAFDVPALPGFIARLDGKPAGLVTLHHDPAAKETEVITLSVRTEDRGVAARLLDAAEDAARAAGSHRVFLTTGNENLRALAFYQRRGWRLCAVHRGALDHARAQKPGMPLMAPNGVPMHDELELELTLHE